MSNQIFEAILNKNYNYLKQNLRQAVNAIKDGLSPLMYAITLQDEQAFQILYDRGKDAQNQWGFTPLMLAAHFNHKKFFDFSINHFMKQQSIQQYLTYPAKTTALQIAAENGYIEIAKTLFIKEAEICKFTAVHLQCVCLDLFSVNQQQIKLAGTDFLGRTPLHYYVCSACKNNCMDDLQQNLQQLMRYQGIQDNQGFTALMYAVLLNNKQMVQTLIQECQLEICQQSVQQYKQLKEGFTALLLSTHLKYYDISLLLLEEIGLTTTSGQKAMDFTTNEELIKLLSTEACQKPAVMHTLQEIKKKRVTLKDNPVKSSYQYVQNYQLDSSLNKSLQRSQLQLDKEDQEYVNSQNNNTQLQSPQLNQNIVSVKSKANHKPTVLDGKTTTQKMEFLQKEFNCENVISDVHALLQQLNLFEDEVAKKKSLLLNKQHTLEEKRYEAEYDYQERLQEIYTELQEQLEKYLKIVRVDVACECCFENIEQEAQIGMFQDFEVQKDYETKDKASNTMISLISIYDNMVKVAKMFEELQILKLDLETALSTFKLERREFREKFLIVKQKCQQNEVYLEFSIDSELEELDQQDMNKSISANFSINSQLSKRKHTQQVVNTENNEQNEQKSEKNLSFQQQINMQIGAQLFNNNALKNKLFNKKDKNLLMDVDLLSKAIIEQRYLQVQLDQLRQQKALLDEEYDEYVKLQMSK